MAHHLLNQKEEVFELLCQKLLKAQERMKVQADKHRRDADYQVLEKVWVKVDKQERKKFLSCYARSYLKHKKG